MCSSRLDGSDNISYELYNFSPIETYTNNKFYEVSLYLVDCVNALILGIYTTNSLIYKNMNRNPTSEVNDDKNF